MTWAELFERAAAFGVAEADIREALARRRQPGREPDDVDDGPTDDGPARDGGDGA